MLLTEYWSLSETLFLCSYHVFMEFPEAMFCFLSGGGSRHSIGGKEIHPRMRAGGQSRGCRRFGKNIRHYRFSCTSVAPLKWYIPDLNFQTFWTRFRIRPRCNLSKRFGFESNLDPSTQTKFSRIKLEIFKTNAESWFLKEVRHLILFFIFFI